MNRTDDSIKRLRAFHAALEHHGHGTAIVSCRLGHEAHWPGPTGEYVPLRAGDIGDVLDRLDELLRWKASQSPHGHCRTCGRRQVCAGSGESPAEGSDSDQLHRRACPDCDRPVPVNNDGSLRRHLTDGWESPACPGSGTRAATATNPEEPLKEQVAA